MLDAAGQLDNGEHSPTTLHRAQAVRTLRDDARMAWKDIAARVGVARSTAFYLYRCHEKDLNTTGPRRAIIATLGLAGPRVTELCLLQAQHLDLDKGKIYVRDAKTPAGVCVIDIRPRLHDELTSYRSSRPAPNMEEPAFPTRNGTARTKDTVRARVILPVARRANELRAQTGVPPIRAHVTPHTLRRTYITFMLAAGFDLPCVQDQVGHADPSRTLRLYAQVIRRPDRDQLRAEARALFGERATPIASEESRLARHTDSWRGHHPPQRDGLER